MAAPDAAIVRVDFSDEVLGASVAQGPKTAVAFARKADAAIGASAVTLQVRASVGSDGLSPQAVSCFDKEGVALSDARVELRR